MFQRSGNRRRAAVVTAVTGVTVSSLLLAGCGGGAAGSSADKAGPSEFTVLTAAENPLIRTELETLAKDQCKAENTALPLKNQTVAQADVVQKITLLASQDALPVMFVAGTDQVRPDGDLGKSKLVVDYQSKLTELGVWNDILPGAAKTVQSVYGGSMVSLPFQYNIEGIFYNKSLFAKHKITPPSTWDELVTASAQLTKAGVIPITEAGDQGWPLTRLIGNHIFRSLGPDAMQKVEQGKAKLTDPPYVAGAKAVADLAAAGAFGQGVTSRDTDTAHAQFLNGKAGMTYDGSWLLANINDPEQNKIGADNVGFLPFPTVSGGVGTAEQWPANTGTVTAVSTKAYSPKVGAWLKCIAQNYGSSAMNNQKVISGFKLNQETTDVPPLTKELQGTVQGVDQTMLWFDARFDAKTAADAGKNVALLTTGKMSAKDYMSSLQADLDQADPNGAQ